MKRIETSVWCISNDGETFFDDNYANKEDAIAAVKEELEDGYVGRCVRLEFDERDISYDETGYRLGEILFEEIDDVSEGWEMTAEQEIELSKILAKEAIKYINENDLQPTCFKVIDIEEVRADEQK